MSALFYLAAILRTGVVRLGPLRVSEYGLCAAVGLVAALRLSLRTAQLADIVPADLWDAGLTALTAAFAVSRALLILRDWHAFTQFPMLVLALPSFTYLGMGLTALLVLVYLRRKRLPILRVMDAWAPCGAVLAVGLEIGHALEGSDGGMPWLSGWRLIPVQAMGAAVAAALTVVLLRILKRLSVPGMATSVGLIAGGAIAFALDMLSQPTVSGDRWLEPGQWIALGAMVAGAGVCVKCGFFSASLQAE